MFWAGRIDDICKLVLEIKRIDCIHDYSKLTCTLGPGNGLPNLGNKGLFLAAQ